MVIDTLQLDIIVNNKGTTAKINNTTKALKNLHKVISDINGAGGVDGTINGGGGGGSSSRGGSSRSSGAKSASSLMKNLNFGSMVAKLYFVRNITKQLGQNLAKVVQYGIDYEETLNLWQVAMKGNTTEARKFITEMNKAYGVSEATLMNYQAIFKNMLSALGGVSHNIAYDLSELMTQMALDYASLYNVGIEESMTKFQAVLAGQVRPIRNESGYDITQATLGEIYKDIGGTKTVRQLSETEKRLLRILAVYRQMKDTAIGDLEKTITSSANQLRLMGDTIKDIATWIGVGANQWLQQSNILIKINAYLLALRELAKSFAISMGYIEPTGEDNKSAEQKQTDNILEGAEGTADAYEEANKQVDELQGKLLGFDKFQVLSSAGVGDTNSDIDKILEELQKAKDEYQGILDQSQNIALFGDAEKKIKGAYDILKDLGFVLEDIKDEEGNVIGQQWVKDGKTVKEILQEIWTTIKGIFTFIGLMTKPWLVLVFAIEEAYGKNEDFRNSVNTMLKQLGDAGLKVFTALGNLFIQIAPILSAIVEGFAGIINWLDKMGLLETVIQKIVLGLIAWRTAQRMLSLMSFINQVKMKSSAISVLTTKIYSLDSAMLISGVQMSKFQYAITLVTSSMKTCYGWTTVLLAGISLLTSGIHELTQPDLTPLQRLASILKIVAGAAFLAAAALATKKTADAGWLAPAMAIAIGVGIVGTIASVAIGATQAEQKIPKFANGGLAEKGSLFYAGEAGPELVTQTSGGGSTIMNMQQLEDAVARGMMRSTMATQSGEGQQITVNVSGRNLFSIFVDEARSNGYELVKVR